MSAQSGSAPTIRTGSKVRLADNLQETKLYDRLADLFVILTTLEHLEVAYVRDTVKAKDYQMTCSKLLGQYRTWMSSSSGNEPGASSLSEFIQQYHMSCPAALARIKDGVPATLQHSAGGGGDGAGDKFSSDRSLNILTVGERFITAMDSLKLNMKAADELFPIVNDILENMSKFDALPPDHESRTRVQKWASELTRMKASDELTEEQARQMSFDLETAYNAFRKFLEQR